MNTIARNKIIKLNKIIIINKTKTSECKIVSVRVVIYDLPVRLFLLEGPESVKARFVITKSIASKTKQKKL